MVDIIQVYLTEQLQKSNASSAEIKMPGQPSKLPRAALTPWYWLGDVLVMRLPG